MKSQQDVSINKRDYTSPIISAFFGSVGPFISKNIQ